MSATATNNCLKAVDYNVDLLNEGLRRDALRRAVVSFGLSSVLHSLSHLSCCYLNASSDLMWMTSEAYPLSFRAFGFSMMDSDSRLFAVSEAVLWYGLKLVLTRIALIVSRKCNVQEHRKAWAEVVRHLLKEFSELKPESILPPVIKELLKEQAPLSLRDYGYSMSLPAYARQRALASAIKERGLKKVCDRLKQVGVYQRGSYKRIVADDMAFCDGKP
jgi:hypothetical protein